MKRPVVVVTGAAGFLGSATVLGLVADYVVIGIDRRAPSESLLRAGAGVEWEILDIADTELTDVCLRAIRKRHGRLDFVIHFAAFYHFGSDWLPEYDRTNVGGTRNILAAAAHHGARRIIFASSVAATLPPTPGQRLTERSNADGTIPYARSKAIGESIVEQWVPRLPGVVLRIGGVFSDWCELPPLHSLIEMWSRRGPLGRVVAGQGKTGIPYIHRSELVSIVKACLSRHEELGAYECLLACEARAVLHEELFPVIRRCSTRGGSASRPVRVSPSLAKAGIILSAKLGSWVGIEIFEQPWMADFIDRPWLTDCRYSAQKLGYRCRTETELLERVSVLMSNRRRDPSQWDRRNRDRGRGHYRYRRS